MYKFKQAIEYNGQVGAWEFNFPKTYKDVHSQAGFQIIIDPGLPTGDCGAIYKANDAHGLKNATITFKGYDDVSGWVSKVKFSIPQLLEALIKIVPADAADAKTFILALNDLKLKEDEQ